MGKFVFAVIAAVVCWQVGAAVEGLKVGFSRVDITPPYGVFMPGYYIDRQVIWRGQTPLVGMENSMGTVPPGRLANL